MSRFFLWVYLRGKGDNTRRQTNELARKESFWNSIGKLINATSGTIGKSGAMTEFELEFTFDAFLPMLEVLLQTIGPQGLIAMKTNSKALCEFMNVASSRKEERYLDVLRSFVTQLQSTIPGFMKDNELQMLLGNINIIGIDSAKSKAMTEFELLNGNQCTS